MSDYTLVMRVQLRAVDDLEARQSARRMLEQMRVAEVCPQARLVLRRQGPDQSRNLLGEIWGEETTGKTRG